jgi:hypothetical protein
MAAYDINILSLSSIYKYIETNQLNVGIIVPYESSGLNNLRQLIFNKDDKTILKKSFTIDEVQNYLFHSKNKIDKNFLNKEYIHIYFGILPDITSLFDESNVINQEIHNLSDNDDLILVTINFDIYNINELCMFNLQKSLTIFYTIKNFKENNFYKLKNFQENFKKIFSMILNNKELINLIHISYDDFMNK